MMGEREVLPVFYDVRSDDVELRTRLHSDDPEVLEKEYRFDIMNQWRKCLKRVGNIKGLNLEESQGQGELIKRVEPEALYKTKQRFKNVSDYLIHIKGQVGATMKLLDDRINHVRFIVTHRVGAIGKTALPKVISTA